MDEPTGTEPADADSARPEDVLAAALTRMHEWPAAGRFVIARDNTFAAHLALVKSPRGGGLPFAPDEHSCFDGIIAFRARRPGLFSPGFEPLRDNLAVLRNYILGLYYQDAETYGDDITSNTVDVADIAGELARGLRNENNPLPKWLAPRLESSLLNTHNRGGTHAYLYLLARQRKEGWLADLTATLRSIVGLSTRDWGLPPLAQTPFGAAAAEPVPSQDVLAMSDEQLDRYCRDLKEMAAQEVAKYEQSRKNIPPVESNLDSVLRREVIDHGIIILRWFRNVEFPDKSAMEMLEAGTPAEKAEMVGAVGTFVNYYQQIAARAMQRDPALAQREEVRKAGLAARILQHTIKLLAALEKPVSMAQTQQISSDQTQQPDRWHDMANRTVDRLMDTMKGGLESMVSAFEQQQQDAEQQQQEEAMEQAAEAATSQGDQSRRKRRRRKHRSGATAKSQQKVDLAIRADDYALGQGVFSTRGNTSARHVHDQITLKQSLQVREVALKDMELVKALGKTLAQSAQNNPQAQAVDGAKDGKSAKDKKSGGGGAGSLPSLSGLAVSEASLNDKLAPDQQDVATRILDQRRRDSQGPKKQI